MKQRIVAWLNTATGARVSLRIVAGLISDVALMVAVYLATGFGFWRCLLVAMLLNLWWSLRRFSTL